MIIGLIGKGGFAREVTEYLKHEYPMCEVAYFEHDNIKDADACEKVLIAIGDPSTRQKIANNYPLMPYTKYKSNNALGYNFQWGDGVIICPAAVITTNVILGSHVQVNLGATIGHDCEVGSFTTISPGVNISGNVKIGERCYIGTNASIREKITICDDVIIGAGAVVIKDITEPGTYTGIPCKKKS